MSNHEDTNTMGLPTNNIQNTAILQLANTELLWGCHRFILLRIAWLAWSGILSGESWRVNHTHVLFPIIILFSVVGLT